MYCASLTNTSTHGYASVIVSPTTTFRVQLPQADAVLFDSRSAAPGESKESDQFFEQVEAPCSDRASCELCSFRPARAA